MAGQSQQGKPEQPTVVADDDDLLDPQVSLSHAPAPEPATGRVRDPHSGHFLPAAGETAAAPEPAPAAPRQQPAAAEPPAPARAAHDPELSNLLRSAGYADDDLAAMSPALFLKTATIAVRQQRAAAQQQQPAGPPPAKPAADPIDWGVGEDGKALTEADWHPHQAKQIRRLHEQEQRLKRIEGRLEQQTRETVFTSIDSAFNAMPANLQKLFGKGGINEVPPDAGKRRAKIVAAAGVSLDDPPHLVNQKIQGVVAEFYGTDFAPAPAPAPAPAEAALPPQRHTAAEYAAAGTPPPATRRVPEKASTLREVVAAETRAALNGQAAPRFAPDDDDDSDLLPPPTRN